MLHPRLGVVVVLLGLCLGLSSCRSHHEPDPTPPIGQPEYDGTVAVAQLAFDEWVRTGTPPDSIERIIRGRRISAFDGSFVDERHIVTVEYSGYQADKYYCTYRPLRQYPKMTLKGDVGRRIIGFEVMTWWGDQSGHVRTRVIGVYGPDGSPMLLAMP